MSVSYMLVKSPRYRIYIPHAKVVSLNRKKNYKIITPLYKDITKLIAIKLNQYSAIRYINYIKQTFSLIVISTSVIN